MGAITGIFMILASMIMGVSVLRDFEYNIESIAIFCTNQQKRLFTRSILGSFAVLLFAFTGILILA